MHPILEYIAGNPFIQWGIGLLLGLPLIFGYHYWNNRKVSKWQK